MTQGVSAEVVAREIFKDSRIEVHFILERGFEATCLGSEMIAAGLKRVIEFLNKDKKSNEIVAFGVSLCFLTETNLVAIYIASMHADSAVEHSA